MYADRTNVTPDIFSTMPHVVRMEVSRSLGRDSISWRQSTITGKTLQEVFLIVQCARANRGILVGNYIALDTMQSENDLELQKKEEERKFHIMAKVHNSLEMWQGSQNLCATQKKSCTQNKQMTAIQYISDTEAIIKPSWSNFQHDGAAAFLLSETSPLPPALSAKDHPGGQAQVLNICPINKIDHHPAKSDENRAAECISDTEHQLNWNRDFDNLHMSKRWLGGRHTIQYPAWQWHQYSSKPWPPKCKCYTKWVQIDSANTEINETCWKVVDDTHCILNKEE